MQTQYLHPQKIFAANTAIKFIYVVYTEIHIVKGIIQNMRYYLYFC